jgi:hypothetical protein
MFARLSRASCCLELNRKSCFLFSEHNCSKSCLTWTSVSSFSSFRFFIVRITGRSAVTVVVLDLVLSFLVD